MADAETFKNEPNPQDMKTRIRLAAIQQRMYHDLSKHLSDEWVENAGAKDRHEFKTYMVTSKTMNEIVDIVSWTMLCIEKEEEASRAGSDQ